MCKYLQFVVVAEMAVDCMHHSLVYLDVGCDVSAEGTKAPLQVYSPAAAQLPYASRLRLVEASGQYAGYQIGHVIPIAPLHTDLCGQTLRWASIAAADLACLLAHAT